MDPGPGFGRHSRVTEPHRHPFGEGSVWQQHPQALLGVSPAERGAHSNALTRVATASSRASLLLLLGSWGQQRGEGWAEMCSTGREVLSLARSCVATHCRG